MKKPILSISILCSGRKETKKCLDSLKTLRERVPSELIIVDTGCDEEMKQLLKEYADRIIPFTWCNDFAKARNAGMRLARGQWFMYLDDDEWFMDTKAIEEFFLSGEYRKYGSANYYQRNYVNHEGTIYRDCWATRLTFISQNVKFKGSIHETFFPLFSPFKLLPSIVEHYGYVYDSPEEERKHSERNISLLEKALPNERDNLRMWIHLVQEYLAHKDYKKLKDFCIEAIKEFQNTNEPGTNKDRGCFYCGLMEARWHLGEFDQEVEDYERAIADERNTDYTTAQLMTYGLDLAIIRQDKEKMRECCRRYLELWEKYRNDEEALILQNTLLVELAFTIGIRNKMCCYQICLDLENGNTDSLKRYFDVIGWGDKAVLITDELIPALVWAMARLPYDDYFVHVADTVANRLDMGNFWEEVKKVEEKEDLLRLGKVLSGIKIPSFDRYRLLVDDYFREIPKKKTDYLRELLKDAEIKQLSVHQRYFMIKLKEAAVIYAGEGKGLEELTKITDVFVTDCLDFYGMFYKERAFEGEMEFLPATCRAAVKLREMLRAQEKNDWAAFSKAMKDTVAVSSAFSGTLKKYAALYAGRETAQKEGGSQEAADSAEEKAGTAEQPAGEISAEMQALSAQIKAQIPVLLGQGMKKQALQVLKRLRELTPGDQELTELEKKILTDE